jgi:hypothetical protein
MQLTQEGAIMASELEASAAGADVGRRDFLRRSAIVGGMVWAAPVISSIGSPAFAFTPGGRSSISNISFVLKNESLFYKYEGACTQVGGGLDQSPGGCEDRADELGLVSNFPAGPASYVDVNCDDPTKWCIKVLQPGYTIQWVLVKGGTGTGDGETANSSCTYYEGPFTEVCVTTAK